MATTTPPHNYYAILEVSPSVDPASIKKVYRRLALKKHPDRRQKDLARATAEFQLVSLMPLGTSPF